MTATSTTITTTITIITTTLGDCGEDGEPVDLYG